MRPITYCILFLLFLLACPIIAKSSDTFYFKNLGVEQGLSHQTVFSILQDTQGFMWFGTKDGLNRFDGSQFKIFKYNPKDPNSIGNNTVLSLFEDSQYNLWVGTQDGVYIYNPEKESFTAFEEKGPEGEKVNGPILAIKEDLAGNIWMASSTQGLFRFNAAAEKLKYFHHQPEKDNSLAYGSISSLAIDKQGTVWIGILGSGVQKYIAANETFEEYWDLNDVLKQDLIFDLYDHGKELLIGTKNGGLKRLDKTSKDIEDVLVRDAENKPLLIRDIIQDNSNQLWICTELGIFKYDPLKAKYQHIQHNPNDSYSLSDNATYSIFQDKEGGIWVGTYFGGINYLPNANMQFDKYYPISNRNSISGRRVREMVEDEEGNIWVGTEDAGLNKFDPLTKTFTQFGHGNRNDQLSYHNIHGLLNHNQKLWVSSHSMNLNIDLLDLKTQKVQKINQSNFQNPVYDSDIFSIYKDSQDAIWIGTISGIYKVDESTMRFEFVEEAGIHFTLDILEDNVGNLWLATTNHGLIKYNPKTSKVTNYWHDKADPNSIPHNSVISLTLDHLGQLWLGTEGGGFAKYRAESDDFLTYGPEWELPSNVVYKILEDDLHRLWLSTSNGLIQFEPKSETFKIFYKKTGLLSDQFNYKSGLKASDGTLYFGSLNGFIAFDPKNFTEKKFNPPVVLTGFKLFNKNIPIDQKDSPLHKSITKAEAVKLNHEQNSLSFSFAALGFTAMDSWTYAYQLEGFDKQWQTLDQNQEISYSHLPPGKYRFRVKTSHATEANPTAEANLLIEILPPFYKTHWAYFLYFLTAIGLIYLFINRYKRQIHINHQENLRELENEKEREIYHAKIEFFTNITHEIRTPLTLIKGPLEEIIKSKDEFSPEIQENLLIMDRNSTRLITLSNQLLDFRRTEQKVFSLNFIKTDIATLLKELHFRFKSKAAQSKIEFDLDLDNDRFYADVDKEAFTKIMSNLISNALKNADTNVRVRLSSFTDNELEVIVSNDGQLIEDHLVEKIFEPFYQITDTQNIKKVNGTGLGLPLARSLAELHEGKLDLIIDHEHKTNCFVLTLPISQKNSLALEDEVMLDVMLEPILEESLVKPAGKSDQSKPAILIAEDNKELQHFLYNHLKKEFVVFKAENGQEALNLLDSKPIDLIISDIMMPVMNGFDLCKAVKGQVDYSHIPVVLLTAKQNLQSKIEGLEMGADVYIEKPFSMDYLTLQIKNLLHYRDQIRQSFANSPLVLAETIAHTHADEQFLTKINQIILDNLSNEIFGVNELAEAMNTSQSSLLRKIKGISQLTPNEYIRLVRLKKAAEMLQAGTHTITEICSLVGFNSPSYFSKCFAKQFGELPKDYQKTS
ncbi:two-component regulator propeller domain-containing protein [Litoribacter populi]|uniref:two-component regulator propeller domain-containing protein n=1 Tax=Litoribacter populi TaxID=2598460 RepID=UPI00117D755A|nr:two-component regulator propeller domain-containing protein [Litoribacter populi]